MDALFDLDPPAFILLAYLVTEQERFLAAFHRDNWIHFSGGVIIKRDFQCEVKLHNDCLRDLPAPATSILMMLN